MLIQPKIRGFICTTAHPTGCFQSVLEQVNYIKQQGPFKGPKNVLVIGASTGYGLASRIAATFGAGAKTIGVFFERAAENNRTATAGWYNTAAFEQLAHAEKHYAKSINGDAFSDAIKQQTIALIKQDLGQVDLIIYSLASPRRVHPHTGQVFSSVLKPIGAPFIGKTVDPFRHEVKDITLDPASPDDIANTVAVMGGDDWQMWIDLLAKENVLAEGVKTLAYDYVGPELTYAIYKKGTIGRAKDHLYQTAVALNQQLKTIGGEALLSVNKALVTQASSAIPVVPLYISLLYKLMKSNGTHEGCIEQIGRLFKSKLYADNTGSRDQENRIRMDDWEMQSDIQQKIIELWPRITSDNLAELTDIAGYCQEFNRLFGFDIATVDYSKEVNPELEISSIQQ